MYKNIYLFILYGIYEFISNMYIFHIYQFILIFAVHLALAYLIIVLNDRIDSVVVAVVSW